MGYVTMCSIPSLCQHHSPLVHAVLSTLQRRLIASLRACLCDCGQEEEVAARQPISSSGQANVQVRGSSTTVLPLPSDFSLCDTAEEKKKPPFSRDPPSACQRQSPRSFCVALFCLFFSFPSSSADTRCEAPVKHDRGQHHRLGGLCDELAPL